MSAYGRQDDEWDVLVRTGKQFLRERALMERNTSYTEMSVTLARRTGCPAFDFSEQAERVLRRAICWAGSSRKRIRL